MPAIIIISVIITVAQLFLLEIITQDPTASHGRAQIHPGSSGTVRTGLRVAQSGLTPHSPLAGAPPTHKCPLS